MSVNFLSGILAVIFALTSLCGGLAGTKADRPFTGEFSIEMDGDLSALGVTDQPVEVTGAVVKLLSALSVSLSADTSVGQMQVKLNGTPVSFLSVQKQEDGWAAVSSLFPSTLLTVKNETLASFSDTSGTGPLASIPVSGGMDFISFAAAVTEPVTAMAETFRGTRGEPETGSFTVGGLEYTQKTPYRITTKEALEQVLTTVRTILDNKAVAGLISRFGQDISPESLDETIESIRKQDDSELPVLAVAEYSSDNGNTALEISMEKDGEGISFLSAATGGVTTVTLNALNQLNAVMVIDEENNQYRMDLAFASEEVAMNLTGSLKIQDEGCDLEIALSMPVGETPLSLKLRAQVNGEAPVFEAAEGLKETAYETLVQDQDAAAAFNTEIMQSAMTLLLKISTEYPEVMTLMTSSGTSQSPDAGEDPAEESPAGEITETEDSVEENPEGNTPAEETPTLETPVTDGSAA